MPQVLYRLIVPRTINENIQQLGWIDGVLFMLARLLNIISRGRIRLVRYYLVAQPIRPESPDAPPRAPSAESTIQFCDRDAPEVQQFPRPAHVIAQRFAKGHRCLRSTHRSRFSGYIWLARDYYDEDEVRCRYRLADPASSVWDYDVYVAPEFRIGRTFARLWQHASRTLAQEGVKWSFSRISAFNAESLRAHARLGATPVSSVTFIQIGPVQLTITGHFPYIHIGFTASALPELTLLPPR